jgi:hypothetical protein
VPHTPGLHIVRAWRFKNQPDRVHYMVTTHTGEKKHLQEPNTSALGRLLDAALKAQGYTMPASADAEDESGGVAPES